MATQNWKTWTSRESARCIQIPSIDDHKYSRGVLGIISGSKQYPGASVLNCEGAMRTGIGMVRYFGPRFAQLLVLQQRPEVVIVEGRTNAWLIGSGIDSKKISWSRKREIIRALNEGKPTVLDAGALHLVDYSKGVTLITPHYAELADLLSARNIKVTSTAIEGDPKKWASIASEELGATVLLKGNVSVVASSGKQIQLPASPTWLATAGTGDVLAGIIGALIATHWREIQENEDLIASIAATGAFIHSQSGELASSGGPITALSVACEVPKVISKIIR
jgi:hydroxyethylthiazole kinase-like uncharacterized protein yjeF